MRILIFALLVCVACGDDSGTIDPDGGPRDAGSDAARDAGTDAGTDTGTDSGADTGVEDGGSDSGSDAADVGTDAGADVAPDAGGGDPTVVDITDPMMDPRQGFVAGIVGDGRLIVAGGTGGSSTLTETWAFDPSTSMWEELAAIPAPHVSSTGLVLPDGRLLMAGGAPSQFATSTNDAIFIFNPATDSWSAAGTMTRPRGLQHMYLLSRGPDAGKVVMIGGEQRSSSGATYTSTLELYDPTTMMSTALTAEMPTGRVIFMSWEMSDGRIAILGGYDVPGDPDGSATDEILIYDPMDHSVAVQSATLPEMHLLSLMGELPDGRKLVFPGRYSSRAIRAIDPETFAVTMLGEVDAELTTFGQVMVPSGIAYIFGGRDAGTLHDDVLRFDPASGDWTRFPDILPMELGFIQPTALPDGRVVLLGGQTAIGFLVGNTTLFVP